MTEKPNPSDIEALERALSDSATRVSTIWVTYLIFALYLLIAAGTATHRQLLLNEPLKLPLLDINLPLFGFFVLAPILFVIFHFYVLLQVLLLGRTAKVYNDSVDKAFGPTPENALMRQRLSNTLFAQIFSGSPRERKGWLGGLLKAMAWTTLTLAPICVILAFQFAFLPYHSHFATWIHRLLLFAELAVAFLLWPLVLDGRKDFNWGRLRRRIGDAAAMPLRLLFAKDERRQQWQRLRLQVFPAAVCIWFVVSLGLASFPGEPHINLLTGKSIFAVQCDRWISQSFDRLELRSVDVVDDEKLKKMEEATATKGQSPYQGERTRDFRRRDLTCGNFEFADFRRVDLGEARMSGASLTSAELQGADLNNAQLQGMDLLAAQLQGARLSEAQLQGANLPGAELQGANLFQAQLQGANLHHAKLQGADLSYAQLQGVDFFDAQLQGANLSDSELQGASLTRAQLQGADLSNAHLQGANLRRAQLQGADFSNSELMLALISDVYIWRAGHANCSGARVINPKFDRVMMTYQMMNGLKVEAIPIDTFVERIVSQVPGFSKDEVGERLHDQLAATMQENDLAAIDATWRDCAAESGKVGESEYLRQHADFLRDLVCKETMYPKEIAAGITKIWIPNNPSQRELWSVLAGGLLGLDGKRCAATKDMSEETKERLRQFASPRKATNITDKFLTVGVDTPLERWLHRATVAKESAQSRRDEPQSRFRLDRQR